MHNRSPVVTKMPASAGWSRIDAAVPIRPATTLPMAASGAHRVVIESAEFRRLAARRWRVAAIFSTVLFVFYYGYILLLGLRPSWFGASVGGVPIGIPLGIAVILAAWALTAAYVWWANHYYDPEVDRLRRLL